MKCHQRPMLRVVLCLCVSMGLVACQSDSDRNAARPIPSMRDIDARLKAQNIASQSDDANAKSAATAPANAVEQVIGLSIEKLDFLQSASLENFWDAASAIGQRPSWAPLWERNDLRVLIVDAGELGKLTETLPPPVMKQRQFLQPQETTFGASSVRVEDFPESFTTGSVLDKEIFFQLWSNMESRDVWSVGPGTMQFLVRFERAKNSMIGGTVELTPQCFFPRHTVRVRSQAERALDGQVYRVMTTRTKLEANMVMLLSVDPCVLPKPKPVLPQVFEEKPATQPTEEKPAKTPAIPRKNPFQNPRIAVRSAVKNNPSSTQPSTDDSPATQSAASQPATQPAMKTFRVIFPPAGAIAPDEPIEATSLGRWMLTNERFGHATQTLFMIRLSEQGRSVPREK